MSLINNKTLLNLSAVGAAGLSMGIPIGIGIKPSHNTTRHQETTALIKKLSDEITSLKTSIVELDDKVAQEFELNDELLIDLLCKLENDGDCHTKHTNQE